MPVSSAVLCSPNQSIRAHGLWVVGTGLLIWFESTIARSADPPVYPWSVDSMDELAQMSFPAPLQGLVSNRKFRHHRVVKFPSADRVGGLDEWEVPALGPAFADSVQLLLGVNPQDGRMLCGDLRYLAQVAQGIKQWVYAGRIVPQVYRAQGQWWVRWELVGGARIRAWSAELTAAMPPILRLANSNDAQGLFDDIVRELTDPICRLLLGGCVTPQSSLFVAWANDEPWDGGSQELATGLGQWRDSLSSENPALVLKLIEPESDLNDEREVKLGDVCLWRLQVCLRSEGEAAQPIPVSLSDAPALQVAVKKLAEAAQAYPRLRDVPSDVRSLDLLLPAAVVIDLVRHGAQAIADVGITVLLPRSWVALRPALRVHAATPDTPIAANITPVGLNEIVDYRWELALGEIILDPGELAALATLEGDLVRLRGQWVQADGRTLARAARYVLARVNSTSSLSLGAMITDVSQVDIPGVTVESITASGWLENLLDPSAMPQTIGRVPGFAASLRPYQQRGLEWLAYMSAKGLGAVLADDMGLGKTVQLLALMAYEQKQGRGPTLLICPMSVVGNWEREAAKFAPDLRLMVHHGSDRYTGSELAEQAANSDIVLTTYSLAQRDVLEFQGISWDRVVLDEAQHIKNSSTQQAKAIASVNARHRIALTGTPVENRLDELRSILNFINPGMLGSAQSFRARFSIPIEREQSESALSVLRSITSPFILRRVKTDTAVIADLPEKIEMIIRANLTLEQAALYQAVVTDMLNKLQEARGMARKGAVLSALTRLKQVCNHPAHFLGDGSQILHRGKHRSGKVALVEDIVESVLAEDEKILLFTQFRDFGQLLAPYLAERFSVPVPFFHGGVTKKQRDSMIAQFQDAQGPPIMLLSLKAGGVGLNLISANHVVHLDRWWNPAVENQATDRAFRIGQKKNVQIRKLLCVGTVEERIDEMISAKVKLADLAVSSGEKWLTELNTEQLSSLVALGQEAIGD
ncbi:MAG: DEAD/DEAH box helicase [Mycobacteriaceae bacterium]